MKIEFEYEFEFQAGLTVQATLLFECEKGEPKTYEHPGSPDEANLLAITVNWIDLNGVKKNRSDFPNPELMDDSVDGKLCKNHDLFMKIQSEVLDVFYADR